MINRKLAVGAVSIAGFFLNLLCGYADIGGYQAKPTGNNPHSWDGQTLTNIVENASDVPEQMTLGGDFNKMFWISYDFSGTSLDFSNSSNYYVNITGGNTTNAESYGVGTFSTNATGSCQFYFGNPSLSDTNKTLTNGTPLRLTIVDKDSVYGLDQELKFDAYDPSLGTNFTYSGTLGEKIGTILNKLTVQSTYGTPNPGSVEVMPDTISTQTIESVVNDIPGKRYFNTGSTLTND